MNAVAKSILAKLLRRAEIAWGRTSEVCPVTLSFSHRSTSEYFALDTYAQRQECHAELLLAARDGAINIRWDARAGEHRQITAVEAIDPRRVACLIELAPAWDLVEVASRSLQHLTQKFPVLTRVIDAWKRGLKVRGTSATEHQAWNDAARVLMFCDDGTRRDMSIRRVSTTLFHDSKRIEALWSMIDVLSQDDSSAAARSPEEVFAEIGLLKYPSTVLIAATAHIHYGGTMIQIAPPYLGLSPNRIEAFSSLESATCLLTVENLTTFHELTELLRADHSYILLYSAGMPSPSWFSVYARLLDELPESAAIYHWGDIDAGGFRIADRIAKVVVERNRTLQLFGMDGSAVSESHGPTVIRKRLEDDEVNAMLRICDRWGWTDEASWISSQRVAVEQESMVLGLPSTRLAA